MRFLSLALNNPDAPAPEPHVYAEVDKFMTELAAAGVLLAGGGLDAGTRLTNQGGDITVVDGPFAESKESVGGFALIEVGSKEEAIELARRLFGIVGDGVSLVHQVFA